MGQGVSPAFLRDLSRTRRVSLDTNACIHFLGGVEPWSSMVRCVLDRAQSGRLEAQIGGIVLMELLVAPFRTGRKPDVDRVRIFAGGGAGVTTAPISQSVLYAAAEIRALTRLKTPDALVAASAAVNHCDSIIGSDGDFDRLNATMGLRLQSVEGVRLPAFLNLNNYERESLGTT